MSHGHSADPGAARDKAVQIYRLARHARISACFRLSASALATSCGRLIRPPCREKRGPQWLNEQRRIESLMAGHSGTAGWMKENWKIPGSSHRPLRRCTSWDGRPGTAPAWGPPGPLSRRTASMRMLRPRSLALGTRPWSGRGSRHRGKSRRAPSPPTAGACGAARVLPPRQLCAVYEAACCSSHAFMMSRWSLTLVSVVYRVVFEIRSSFFK